jgi:hypothetical protein
VLSSDEELKIFLFIVKMKNWIYHHSTGFLDYTSVLSNSAILLDLPNAPRNLFPNYLHVLLLQEERGLYCMYSSRIFRVLQNPHLIHTTPRVASVTVSLGNVFFNRQSAYLWVQTAPLLADLFLYSYEADFIQGLLKKNENKLAQSFNFTFRYIEDVLALNNSNKSARRGAQFVPIGMPTVC